MLIREDALAEIETGKIDTLFRRWKKPTVQTGGTLMTTIGVLAIEAVDTLEREQVSADDARRAGFGSVAAWQEWYERAGPGTLYRIRVRYEGLDPRQALRQDDDLSADDLENMDAVLDRFDGKTPWVDRVMEVIAANPARAAQDLSEQSGFDKVQFKTRVRRLKGIGLTESLEIGYRLSPRGRVVLAHRRTLG